MNDSHNVTDKKHCIYWLASALLYAVTMGNYAVADSTTAYFFKFTRRDNGFEGDLRETDLNVLQAPPEGGDLRPIDPNELYEASEKHWLRRIIIERIMPIGEAS